MNTQSAGSSVPRIPTLDGLRGIAILVVILFHCLLSTPTSGLRRIDPLIDKGAGLFAPLFLDLFFVISGFLITSILDRTRDADHPVRTFYLRRALRIVPLYYGFLLVIVLFLQHLPERFIGTPASMIWEFSFLTNVPVALDGSKSVGYFYPHFWTLAIEEQFYILWPLLMLLIPKHLNVKTCLAVIAFSLVARAVLAFTVSFGAAFYLTAGRLDGLAAGGLVALLHARRPDLLTKWAKKVMWLSLGACLVGQLSLIVLYLADRKDFGAQIWVTVMPFVATAFFSAVVAQLAMQPQGDRPRWLLSPVLTSVARYSYGMYALHVPLITLLFHYELVVQQAPLAGFDLPYRIYFFILVAGLSYGAGLVSWHLYEKQFLKLAPGYRYSRKMQPAAASLPAAAIPVP